MQHNRLPCLSLTLLPKPMSIELVMPTNHLILCHPLSSCLQSFPASGSFPMSQLLASGGQGTGASASASVFPSPQLFQAGLQPPTLQLCSAPLGYFGGAWRIPHFCLHSLENGHLEYRHLHPQITELPKSLLNPCSDIPGLPLGLRVSCPFWVNTVTL